MADAGEPRFDAEQFFDEQRQFVVGRVESARETWDEGALAQVLIDIGEASETHLRQVAAIDADDGHAVIAAVQGWASAASYATTRFYFDDGPASIFGGGGFSGSVNEKLEDLAAKWSGYLLKAVKATRASSFSIQVGFPFGVAIGLGWGPWDSPPETPPNRGDDGF